MGDFAIKDLNLIGRDLSKTIIVDNIAENYESTTPHNGINILSWFDDLEDRELDILCDFLKYIALN